MTATHRALLRAQIFHQQKDQNSSQKNWKLIQKEGTRFGTNVVEMKFSIENDWIRRVRFAKSKANYKIRELDPVLDELLGTNLS